VVPSPATVPAAEGLAVPGCAAAPGGCHSPVAFAASVRTAPLRTNRADTLDLPDPIPPVRPKRSTWRTVAVRAIASSSGRVISPPGEPPANTPDLVGIAFQA